MCPASGLMASATAWAACRCPVERKLGCSRGCLVPDSPPCPPQVAAVGSQADRKLCMAGFGGMVGFGGMAWLFWVVWLFVVASQGGSRDVLDSNSGVAVSGGANCPPPAP